MKTSQYFKAFKFPAENIWIARNFLIYERDKDGSYAAILD